MTAKLIPIITMVSIIIGAWHGTSHAAIDPNTVVGVWLLDETGDDELSDISGHEHHGEIIGPAKWEQGQFGDALEIGAGNFARVLHTDALSSTTYTVTLWISTKSSGDWIGVLSKSNDNPTRNYTVYIHKDNNTASMSIGNEAGGNWNDTSCTTVVNDGDWHHIAITFDDSTDVGQVFTDGVQEGQYTVGTKIPQNNADVVFAAWHHAGGNSGFIGMLDEIAIFNTVLDDTDILAIKEKGLKELLAAPVSPKGKLATFWGEVKRSR